MSNKQLPAYGQGVPKAGAYWKEYIKQFSALSGYWATLPEAIELWLSQQIDIFAGLYPAQKNGAVWVPASEFKTNDPVFRPYRRKSMHDGCDYDFGEVFIEPNEDVLYLDVDSENDYRPQSDVRWVDFEILDEAGTAPKLTHEHADIIHEAKYRDMEGMVKATDTLTLSMVNISELKKMLINKQLKGDALMSALRSLRLSVTAHPDYTGEENAEWTDLVETSDEAILNWMERDEDKEKWSRFKKGGISKLDQLLMDDNEKGEKEGRS